MRSGTSAFNAMKHTENNFNYIADKRSEAEKMESIDRVVDGIILNNELMGLAKSLLTVPGYSVVKLYPDERLQQEFRLSDEQKEIYTPEVLRRLIDKADEQQRRAEEEKFKQYENF